MVNEERAGAIEFLLAHGHDPQDFIPGFRVRWIELDNACAILRNHGWAGGISFDEAVRSLTYTPTVTEQRAESDDAAQSEGK